MKWIRTYPAGNDEGMPTGALWQITESDSSPGAGWTSATDAQIAALKAQYAPQVASVISAREAAQAVAEQARRTPTNVKIVNSQGATIIMIDNVQFQLAVMPANADGVRHIVAVPV